MEIQQTIQEKIDIEESKEVIEYYQYLRNINQVIELSYWIGNPSVQIISGKILLQPFLPIRTKQEPQNFQLYLKEIFNTNQFPTQQSIKTQQQTRQSHTQQQVQSPPSTHTRCLVLCGIPNSKSPIQVMQTDCISRNSHLIKQIRVIKTVHIKYYGMLLLMKDQKSAGQFFNELYACEYNGLQMERVIIRWVRPISLAFTQLSIEGGNNQMNSLRAINQNSQYLPPQNIFMTFHHQKLKHKLQQEKSQTAYTQLVCVICFQQCTKHAISILCGHYFHLQCLQKWSQLTCPLCRYHQQPPIIKFCQKCNQCQGLWICLICGSRLCCGVNNDILGQDSHIYDHYKTTSHSLSMQLQTKFLFDAKIPAFLHQKFYKDLVQSSSQQEKIMMEQKNIEEHNKKDKITQQIKQYELQVSQQMKRQRLYFEEQINQNLKLHRKTLAKQRSVVEKIRSQIQNVDLEQRQAARQINQIQEACQKKTKQLQILRQLIKMKQQKVQQKRQQISQLKNLKTTKLSQLHTEIEQRKEEILNYRKNLKIRQRLSQKLKGQQVGGQYVLEMKEDKGTNKKKKKSNVKQSESTKRRNQ